MWPQTSPASATFITHKMKRMLYQPKSPRQPSGSSSLWVRMLLWKNSSEPPKRELRDDPRNRADALAVVKDLADAVQPPAVHEHHPVHQLHAVTPAGFDDFPHFGGGAPHRLFHQHVLSGFRRADRPLAANHRRQRDIHGVHRVAGHSSS